MGGLYQYLIFKRDINIRILEQAIFERKISGHTASQNYGQKIFSTRCPALASKLPLLHHPAYSLSWP